MRILLADDHDLVRETIAAFLGSEGFDEVVGTGSLDDAVTVYQQSPDGFDMVLLDLNMPGVSGFSALAWVRSHHPSLPTIMVSANEDPGVMRRALRDGG